MPLEMSWKDADLLHRSTRKRERSESLCKLLFVRNNHSIPLNCLYNFHSLYSLNCQELELELELERGRARERGQEQEQEQAREQQQGLEQEQG